MTACRRRRYPGLSFFGSHQHVMSRLADVPHQTEASQELDEIITDIDLPPEKALVGRALIAVMIVVPAFAKSDNGHPQVVAALVGSRIAAPAEKMTHRIDGENRMIQKHRADEKAPNQARPAADQE